MTTVKLRYVRKKRGKLFWEPTPEMRAKGFLPTPLGDDGPDAHAKGAALYASWLKAKDASDRPTKYPNGTLGAFYDRFRTTSKWTKMKPRTKEDYERAWKRIYIWRREPDQPTLSHTVLTKISTEDCEAFFDWLESDYSPNERYRVIKGLKVLLKDAMVRLRLGIQSPAATLANPQSIGRSAIWLGAEIDKLAAMGSKAGYEAMSLAIRLGWETLYSPVDVRTLQIPQLKRDATGFYIQRDRTKTSKEAYAAVSDGLAADILAYIGEREVGPLVLMRNGSPYRSPKRFEKDFRAVRVAAFGPDEARQFMDIRRSGNVEADAAGADKSTMAKLLANRIDDSKFLEETYTPPTVAKAREVARQRLDGRQKLAHEIMRSRSKSPS